VYAHLHNALREEICTETALHKLAKDAVDGCNAWQGDVEDAKLALEAVGDVVLAATWEQAKQRLSACWTRLPMLLAMQQCN
jgi:hypothetical protein